MSTTVIRTVTGDIAPEDLGFCNNHTHTVVRSDHMMKVVPFMITDDYDAVLTELRSFKAAGGDALIDFSPVGEGRATEDLCRMSEESGVRIIASTGTHIPMFYPAGHWSLTMSEQELTDIFVNEITTGMYVDCNEQPPERQIEAKAGIVKVALMTKDLKEVDERRFRAAVNAALATGASIHCHTDFARKNAVVCAKRLLEMGMPPDRVIIAHTDVYPYAEDSVHHELLDMGVYLDFDSFMNAKPVCDRAAQVGAVIKLILGLVGEGYTKQIMVGDDMLVYTLGVNGGDGMAFNPTILRRWLKYGGLSDEDSEQIFYKNPQRANAIRVA
jgi:predicted metal-dependent phosphotriesterase family hydrolase